MRHSSSDFRSNVAGFWAVGENLFMGNAPMDAAVDAWYDEIAYTNNGRVSSFNSQTGHYTQIVWKDTTDVGCGYYNLLLVCTYGPAGNIMGEFTSQVKAQSRYAQCGRRLSDLGAEEVQEPLPQEEAEAKAEADLPTGGTVYN